MGFPHLCQEVVVRLLGSGGFSMDDGAEQSFCEFLGIEKS